MLCSLIPSTSICNGHGTCVNSKCVCDPWFTGKGDVFTGDGFGCQNPIILDKLMWSLAALAASIFFIRTLPWLFNHYKNWQAEHQRRMERGKSFTWFEHYNYSLLSHIGLQLSVFAYSIGSIYRAVTGENMAVDAPVTGIFLVWYFTYMPADGYLKHRTLVIFSSALGNNQDKTKSLIEFHGRMTLFAVTLATTGTITCAIIGLYIPAQPTLERLLITLFRNISLLLMFSAQWFTDSYILTHLKISKSSSAAGSNSSSNTNTNNNNNNDIKDQPTSRMNELIKHLEQCVTEARATLIFFLVMMIIFNGIPMLYPFQYVLLSFLIIVSSSKSHPLNYFSKINQKNINQGAAGAAVDNESSRATAIIHQTSSTNNMKRLNSGPNLTAISSSVGG
jgi:hypothetical protein